MTRQLDKRVWANQSHQTTGHVTVIFPERDQRPSQPANRYPPVAVQRVHVESRVRERYYDEFIVVDKEKQAMTGRWVLNAIAAHEAYQKALKAEKTAGQSNKKLSFQSKKSTKVEPIENSSSLFTNTTFHQPQTKPQNINQVPHRIMSSPTTISDEISTPLSSFSTATPVDQIGTGGRSILSTRSNSQLDDCSTDQFKDNKNHPCISKQFILACTILAAVLTIGIIIALVLVTILVGKNQSSSTSGSNGKSLLVPFSTNNDRICPTELFNLTDSLCLGQVPYQYYSCFQMSTSTSLTIRFAFQHDTISGHWYFDDISAVQDDNRQLIINGGFENNLTGWIVNISSNLLSETYVDQMTGLAHTGFTYLHGASKNDPVYIEQTFNVTIGEYIHISFWWGYDGGVKIGNTCQATGQLI